ncbi:dienelactone hydrolase family protein [Xylophilus sp.]|uniref:dienelactone hydrolase family protein n=1 Tax=Xylophilus sp. TaxID=2653893 RepID=UPI0013B98BE8|nr:dienelactone hydrolase family protein [Xylophilus sp.]KAF1048728.1 MAG: Carboxymethylenebutenolidase [Xylophilus sp.]
MSHAPSSVNSRFVDIDTPDGRYTAWHAQPARPQGVGILMIPETYNLNRWVRGVADRYAADGFDVLVPDLYWRQEPGLGLDYNPQDQERGRALNRKLDRALTVRDNAAAVAWLRRRLPAGAPVASIGFCLGGELAWLAAGAGLVEGAALYYPTRMREHLALGSTVRVPVVIHFGELDALHTPPDVIAAVTQATQANPLVERHTYLGAGHGFSRYGEATEHPESAVLAERRTRALLARIAQG